MVSCEHISDPIPLSLSAITNNFVWFFRIYLRISSPELSFVTTGPAWAELEIKDQRLFLQNDRAMMWMLDWFSSVWQTISKEERFCLLNISWQSKIRSISWTCDSHLETQMWNDPTGLKRCQDATLNCDYNELHAQLRVTPGHSLIKMWASQFV